MLKSIGVLLFLAIIIGFWVFIPSLWGRQITTEDITLFGVMALLASNIRKELFEDE